MLHRLLKYVSILLLLGSAPAVCSADPGGPITQSELTALVAGGALSENIIYVVRANGLAFRPDAKSLDLLRTAGADQKLLSFLRSARISPGNPAESPAPDLAAMAQRSEHLARAGSLIQGRKFKEAAAELTQALQAGGGDAEAGFVMGRLLDERREEDKAAKVYRQVLEKDPGFPSAHSKLAFVLALADDLEGGMREANIALSANRDDPEGHLSLGVAFALANKLDAAIPEYQEALRLKPDYGLPHFEIAMALASQHDTQNAIVEMRKAIALEPGRVNAHYYLAGYLSQVHDSQAAVIEFRAAKKLAPERVDIRQDLGAELLEVDPQSAKKEFLALIAMAPDFAMAHDGLAVFYFDQADYPAAEAEYRRAARLDPSEPHYFSGLGQALEREHQFDKAIAADRQAIEVDAEEPTAHLSLGRIYTERKDYAKAVAELRTAARLEPDNGETHAQLGRALAGAGDTENATLECKEALRLYPTNALAMVTLSHLLAAKGDTAGAAEYARQAAGIQGDPAMLKKAMTPAKSDGAARNEAGSAGPARVAATSPAANHGKAPGIQDWTDAFAEGEKAFGERRFSDAELHYRDAAAIADTFSPHDEHLTESLGRLGTVYAVQQKFGQASATLQRNADLSQHIFGPASPQAVTALELLGILAMQQKDYPLAQRAFLQVIQAKEKQPPSPQKNLTMDLQNLAATYVAQGAYQQAEPILQRALTEIEATFGKGSIPCVSAWQSLADLYAKWGKYQQAEPYARQALAANERQFGPYSPMLAQPLQTLAGILEKLGKNDEAARLRSRSASVQAAQTP